MNHDKEQRKIIQCSMDPLKFGQQESSCSSTGSLQQEESGLSYFKHEIIILVKEMPKLQQVIFE